MKKIEFGISSISLAGPSGAGKSTLTRAVVDSFRNIEFSISHTSRKPRGTERNGIEYHFISPEEFKKKISENFFAEFQQVYKGDWYGTSKIAIENIHSRGCIPIFDIDVHGALSIKKIYPDALSVIILPPSIEELERRLRKRGTDSEEKIIERLEKYEIEIQEKDKFDHIIINDNETDFLREGLQLIVQKLVFKNQNCPT